MKERCDVMSRVMSGHVGGGSTDVEDVAQASVRACSRPDVRGR